MARASTPKLARQRTYAWCVYILSGMIRNLMTVNRGFPEVDTTRAEKALHKLVTDLERAYRKEAK